MQRSYIPALAVMAAALSLIAAAPQKEAGAAAQLQAAINKETVEADLNGAIKQYAAIAAKYAKTDRAVTAMALVHMADCYRKTGDAEAHKIYEQVVKDYGDQKDAATLARAMLAEMGGATGSGKTTFELVFWDLEFPPSSMAVDRPLVVVDNWATGDPMLRDMRTGETRNLTNLGLAEKGKNVSANNTVISVDGKMVVYKLQTWDETRGPGQSGHSWEIRSVNSDGTGMRIHLSRPDGFEQVSPLALSPDKKTALVRVSTDSSDPRGVTNRVALLSLDDNSLKPFGDGVLLTDYSHYSFSPDGKQVVFGAEGGLFLTNADGGDRRNLLAEEARQWSPFWTPDGKWIVFLSNRTASNAIWAIPSSGGIPRLLKGDGSTQLYGITRDGSLYYRTTTQQSDVHAVQLDPTSLAIAGEPSVFINTFPSRNFGLSFSPDGQWIAWLSERGPDGGFPTSVVVRPAAGGEEKVISLRPMTVFGSFPVNANFPPRWFPDGKALLIRRGKGTGVLGTMVWERVEVADGRETDIYHSDVPWLNGAVIGPDGNTLVGVRCLSTDTPKPCDLVRYDPRTKSQTAEALGGIRSFRAMEFSPDGKWLAVTGALPSDSGLRLFVRPAAGGKLVELARSTDTERIDAANIAWTPDSKQIIYAVSGLDHGSWDLMEMKAVPVEGGTPKIIPVKGQEPSFDPSGRLAYTVRSRQEEMWVAHNLLPSN